MDEVEQVKLDSDAAEELRKTGATLLRDAWPLDALADLRRSLEAFHALRARELAAGRVAGIHARLHDWGAGVGDLMVLSRRLDLDLLRRMFNGSAYHRLCQDQLGGDEFFVQLRRLVFRTPDPSGNPWTLTPWHQDSGSQDMRISQVLNCWTPLDAVAGRDCPGLELVRIAKTPPRFPLKPPSGAPHDEIAIDHDLILSTFGSDHFWTPELQLGDGLVFTQDVIHRTHVTTTMTKPRLGFEFRVFSPLHLRKGCSVRDIEDAERLV